MFNPIFKGNVQRQRHLIFLSSEHPLTLNISTSWVNFCILFSPTIDLWHDVDSKYPPIVGHRLRLFVQYTSGCDHLLNPYIKMPYLRTAMGPARIMCLCWITGWTWVFWQTIFYFQQQLTTLQKKQNAHDILNHIDDIYFNAIYILVTNSFMITGHEIQLNDMLWGILLTSIQIINALHNLSLRKYMEYVAVFIISQHRGLLHSRKMTVLTN